MASQIWHRVDVEDGFTQNPREWLANQLTEGMPYLLVHLDDGVLWGCRTDSGELHLASESIARVTSSDEGEPLPKQVAERLSVSLRAETLQQARLFGPAGELFLWRAGDGFAAREIQDGMQPGDDALPDEHYYLWGDRIEGQVAPFTILKEGQQQLFHAPPLALQAGERAALIVRHYVSYDEQDQAYITASRLVNLTAVPGRNDGHSA